MILVLCMLINIFVIAYLVAKRWKLVARVYLFALLVLSFLSLFYLPNDSVVLFLKEVLGEAVYEGISYGLQVFSYGTLYPYLAIELLTLVIAIVITIKATEKIVLLVKNNDNSFESINNSNNILSVLPERFEENSQRLYLFNCQMLC